MIRESRYWKTHLLGMARRLEAAGDAGKPLTGRRSVQVERDLFIGCYSIRKLIHAPSKLTDGCKNMKVEVRVDFSKNNPVTLVSKNEIDEFYHLGRGSAEQMDLEFFCDRIIHSFTFLMEVDEDGKLGGFYFGSDLDRERCTELRWGKWSVCSSSWDRTASRRSS